MCSSKLWSFQLLPRNINNKILKTVIIPVVFMDVKLCSSLASEHDAE
jgi:hypothetical protein